jgi:hypothetical protein
MYPSALNSGEILTFIPPSTCCSLLIRLIRMSCRVSIAGYAGPDDALIAFFMLDNSLIGPSRL